MAQSGHPNRVRQCPLLGVKRTWRLIARMSANDPSRAWTTQNLNWLSAPIPFKLAHVDAGFHRRSPPPGGVDGELSSYRIERSIRL
jgi:hypothetical protein